jgi:site-specific recombinase XerD
VTAPQNRFREPKPGLQQFFKWLAAEEELPDPMAGMKPPHVPDKPVPVFADEELPRLERACAGRAFQQRRDAAVIAVFRSTGILAETGQKVSGREFNVSGEEKAVRGELRALAAERARLLAEIAAREAELRTQQATFDQARRAAATTPGRGKKPSVARPSRRSGPSSPC